jgi:hypothetical protein
LVNEVRLRDVVGADLPILPAVKEIWMRKPPAAPARS